LGFPADDESRRRTQLIQPVSILSRFLLLASTIFLLCQCADSPTPSSTAEPAPLTEDEATILVSNQNLARQLEVLELKIKPGTVATAQAVLKNKAGEGLKLRVRTLFKNIAGVTVAVSPWQPLLIGGGDAATYRMTTKEPSARRMLVQIEPQP
jgi:hypothetical protein